MSRDKFSIRRAPIAGLVALSLVATPTPILASEAAQPFSAPRDRASFDRALQCLTQAVYYEARSESDEGQRAVAQVVLNRVRHPSYPDSVCGVVYQGSHRRTGCQFTFTCDGSIRPYVDGEAWARAERIARSALRGSVYGPVGLALNYHTTAIRPYWAPSLIQQAVVGAHIFYRKPGSGSNDAFRQSPSAVEPGVGYASANAAGRAPRVHVGRTPQNYQTARLETATIERPRIERPRVERATVERPRVERAVFARPVSARLSAARSASATPARAQARSQASPEPRRGPRTTVESGVRVARGS